MTAAEQVREILEALPNWDVGEGWEAAIRKLCDDFLALAAPRGTVADLTEMEKTWAGFHHAWSACVGTHSYNKAEWLAVERQLNAVEHNSRPAPPVAEPKLTAEGLAALRAVPVDVVLVQEFREGGDDAPIEVHLNTRDCEPMQPGTAEALGRAFKLAHEQLSAPPATGDDAEQARDASDYAASVCCYDPLTRRDLERAYLTGAKAVARQSLADREALAENREMVKSLLLLAKEQKAEVERLREAVEFMRAERGG